MWSDNEASVALLGFDYLVDELEVLVTNERLLPLTVLVDGDWGSGKSSLMSVMRDRLLSDENKGRFIVVEFTPWRFEDLARIYENMTTLAHRARVNGLVGIAARRRARLRLPTLDFRARVAGHGFWGGVTLSGDIRSVAQPDRRRTTVAFSVRKSH